METPYEIIGGDQKVKELANEFYKVMSEERRFKPLRDLHAKDLSKITEELYFFLSGWLGGPHLYYQKHGTLCLEKPHEHISITSVERDMWLDCMQIAMKNVSLHPEAIEMLTTPLFELADTIRGNGSDKAS